MAIEFCCMSRRQIEKLKQEMCKIFDAYNLKITTDVNHKIVDFLDVSLDLNTGLFKPFMKPNNTILYVNKNINHPQAVNENLPSAVNRRLSTLSADENIFKQAIPHIRRP